MLQNWVMCLGLFTSENKFQHISALISLIYMVSLHRKELLFL